VTRREPAFDSLADLYDLFQDWPGRLPREVAFLDALLRRENVRTVLDAACGTGAHLAALADLGYEVTGSDLSPGMVERADATGAGPVHVVGFDRVHEVVTDRDAVLVLGNSLPNAGSEAGVRAALSGLAGALRPGGILVLHVLNYPKLIASGGGLGPVRRVAAEGREYLFTKLFEVGPERVVLYVIALIGVEGAWGRRLLRSELWPVSAAWLRAALVETGFEVAATHAGFRDEPFDDGTSADLLVVARKTGGKE